MCSDTNLRHFRIPEIALVVLEFPMIVQVVN